MPNVESKPCHIFSQLLSRQKCDLSRARTETHTHTHTSGGGFSRGCLEGGGDFSSLVPSAPDLIQSVKSSLSSSRIASPQFVFFQAGWLEAQGIAWTSLLILLRGLGGGWGGGETEVALPQGLRPKGHPTGQAKGKRRASDKKNS